MNILEKKFLFLKRYTSFQQRYPTASKIENLHARFFMLKNVCSYASRASWLCVRVYGIRTRV